MKEKLKAVAAFALLGLLVLGGFFLVQRTGGAAFEPYRLGFCVSGAVFLLMLFVPNILWARRKKPAGYETAAAQENKVLLLFERAGEAVTTAALAIFPALDPAVQRLPEGLHAEARIVFWMLAFALMLLYEGYWVRYFRSAGTMADFYASFAGFPVAGATLPVLAVLLLGIYGQNAIVIGAAVILGIGHIGIHLGHRKALERGSVMLKAK